MILYYLDPGTGSMLFSALFSILVSIYFFFRKYYFQIITKLFSLFGVKSKIKNTHKVVFFSEGRKYKQLFYPLLEEFDKRKISATYLTLDNTEIKTKVGLKNIDIRYLGNKNLAFAKLNNIEADIFITTTPSLDVFQIKKSKNVKHYCNILHSCVDISSYSFFSFDYFDSIFITGKHQEKSIRQLEKIRNTTKKQIYETGYLILDSIYKKKENDNIITEKNTILIAPSWGNKSILYKYGFYWIEKLLNDYKVILRPHPQSFTSEKELINKIKHYYKTYNNFFIDSEDDNYKSLAKSSVLISDFSGVIFDYVFAFEKPVLIPNEKIDWEGQEAQFLHFVWEEKIMDKYLFKIDFDDIRGLKNYINNIDKSLYRTNIKKIKSEYLFNEAHASKVAAENSIKILENVA